MPVNFLIIICDQLSALALEAYGGSAAAPHMNALARGGTLLENAYCNTPLCQPSRASFWTSRYPHETKVDSNLKEFPFPAVADDISTLGEVFSRAGYEAVHFGKEHDYGALRGFRKVPSEQIEIPREDPAINFSYETFLDLDTTANVCRWIREEAGRSRPFMAVADLQNPHNICNYIGENTDGCRDFAGDPELPELPANFSTPDMASRPEFIQYLCCAHRRLKHACRWSEADYRHYLYAYQHYIGRVDRQIGEILEALETRELRANTLLVFMADHGEGMAAHGLVTKYGNFYEEAMRVPFIFNGPGVRAGGRIKGLASLLDLKPTLQAFASLPPEPGDRGHNLQPVLTAGAAAATADAAATGEAYVIGSWSDEFSGYTVPGRMYRFKDYKYMAYRDYVSKDSAEIGLAEEFYDLGRDPGEQKNLREDPAYAAALAEARAGLKAYCERTQDPFYESKPDYDRQAFRQHQPGYRHHEGLTAVEIHVAERKKK